jgi:hypothetical protein
VPEIARAAWVATQTVYASTGGKAAMFAKLLQPAINDPTAAEAMPAARQATDPERVPALCATAARSGQERYRGLIVKSAVGAVDDRFADTVGDDRNPAGGASGWSGQCGPVLGAVFQPDGCCCVAGQCCPAAVSA